MASMPSLIWNREWYLSDGMSYTVMICLAMASVCLYVCFRLVSICKFINLKMKRKTRYGLDTGKMMNRINEVCNGYWAGQMVLNNYQNLSFMEYLANHLFSDEFKQIFFQISESRYCSNIKPSNSFEMIFIVTIFTKTCSLAKIELEADPKTSNLESRNSQSTQGIEIPVNIIPSYKDNNCCLCNDRLQSNYFMCPYCSQIYHPPYVIRMFIWRSLCFGCGANFRTELHCSLKSCQKSSTP